MTEPAVPELVDRVAAAVRAVPGVVDLHGGMFGESATYLPGRRVPGVRHTADGTEVHVSLAYAAPIRPTADEVRRAVAGLVEGPVHVIIEDLVAPAATTGST